KRIKSENPLNYNNEYLDRLEETKNSYLRNIAIIQKSIETKRSSLPPLSPENIAHLEKQLYELPINGETLKKVKQEAEK
ncbi:7995_t:CDS:1, partial [Ambispora gerdemannii]